MTGTPLAARIMFAARGSRSVPRLIQRVSARVRYARSADAGFTLLETIVSFIIFAFIAVSATAAIANSISTSSATKHRVAAANLAQQTIAKARADQTALKATPNTTTTDGAFTIAQTAVVPTSGATSCPVGSSIPVTVKVSWKDDSKVRSVRMDTVIAC